MEKKEMSRSFSIIIPAFNAHNTISRCLDSVYNLPVQESFFEVIVIDDCSTDDTVSIVGQYEKKHVNLALLRQPENHRQGAARNRGLSVATGKHIVFLDSDDELEKGILSALSLAEENELEMTAIKCEKVGKTGEHLDWYELPYKRDCVFSGCDLQTEHPFWCTGPVLYVYLKSFLGQVNYPFAEDVLYEDCDFVNVHLYHAKRMGYSDETAYRVHENPFSTTHTISFKHVCDYALLGTRMLDFYHQIESSKSAFASSVLEGGSFNIMKAFRSFFRLDSFADVRSFYERLDEHADRRKYLSYREPAYCWTRWTRFCLKHKDVATIIAWSIIQLRRFDLQKMIKQLVR